MLKKEEIKQLTLQEFLLATEFAQGKDPLKWKFKCPNCGSIHLGEDLAAVAILDMGIIQKEVENE